MNFVLIPLALLICFGMIAAPFRMRKAAFPLRSRICVGLVLTAILAAAGWGIHGMPFGLSVAGVLASCFAVGEVILLIYDGVCRPTHIELCAYNVQNPIVGPPPVTPGAVPTRHPKADPHLLRRLQAYRRRSDYQPGKIQRRA